MSTLVVCNPMAGRGRGGRALARLTAAARRHAIPVTTSRGPDDLVRIARRAAEEGRERLVVAGGDGSWHHATQGLAGSDTALAPLPLGTGNDLARELGHHAPLEAALAGLLVGEIHAMDLLAVGGRFVCGVAGAGFDSQVAEFSAGVRRLRGPLVYAYSVLRTLARFAPPTAAIRLDGEATERLSVTFVLAANTSRFGGGMRIAPAASPWDGRFDLVVARSLSRLGLLRVFPRVYSGTHLRHPAISVRTGRSLGLAFDRPVALYGDGERVATLGADETEISLIPRKLRVVVGRGVTPL